MSTYNKFEDRNLSTSEQLVKRYFWFLVDEYGFKYDKYNFISEEMLIQSEPGHVTPRIFINKVGEPDFVRLNFEWILEFFHGTAPSESAEEMHTLGEDLCKRLSDTNWKVPKGILVQMISYIPKEQIEKIKSYDTYIIWSGFEE